jgi:very-short-patch-repair endonuclease
MPDHDALRILTARQHGVVGRRQLADLGFNRQAVANAVRRGQLERLSPRVLRLCGSPPSVLEHAMAAVLDLPGSAVALHSAAAMYELLDYSIEPVHVLSGRSPHRGEGHLGRAHSTVRWHPTDVIRMHGIPVTTPLRTLCDLAARIQQDKLGLTCDRMLSDRMIRIDHLQSLALVLPDGDHVPGVKALRRLIESRPPGYRPAESGLERRFEKILDAAGLAPFERQVDIGDDDGWIGRVDFADRANRVIVEVQSDRYHAGAVDRERDRVRIERLRRAGWTVIEVWEREIWRHPDQVVAKVRAARARARAR